MRPDLLQARKGAESRLHVIEAFMGMEATKGKTQTHTKTASALCFTNPAGVANFAVPSDDTHAIFAIPCRKVC
jgi:hypothetical protein